MLAPVTCAQQLMAAIVPGLRQDTGVLGGRIRINTTHGGVARAQVRHAATPDLAIAWRDLGATARVAHAKAQ